MVDKRKLSTLWWVVSLALMVLVALTATIADMIGVVMPDGLVICLGLVSLFSLFGFGYGMVKKVEERNEDFYDVY